MARALRDLTEPELRRYMHALAHAVESVLPAGTLFAVLVFDDPGLAQYVTNAHRADVIRALRESADRLEANEDVTR